MPLSSSRPRSRSSDCRNVADTDMPADPRPNPRQSILRFVVRSWLLVAVGLVYIIFIFVTRWSQNRALEKKAAEEKRAQDQRAVDMLGANRFDILNFYVTPVSIHPGETAQLCYGVSNAKAVRLDPPAGAVWPSPSRCVDISPRQTTTYTLTAENANGETKTATVVVQVR